MKLQLTLFLLVVILATTHVEGQGGSMEDDQESDLMPGMPRMPMEDDPLFKIFKACELKPMGPPPSVIARGPFGGLGSFPGDSDRRRPAPFPPMPFLRIGGLFPCVFECMGRIGRQTPQGEMPTDVGSSGGSSARQSMSSSGMQNMDCIKGCVEREHLGCLMEKVMEDVKDKMDSEEITVADLREYFTNVTEEIPKFTQKFLGFIEKSTKMIEEGRQHVANSMPKCMDMAQSDDRDVWLEDVLVCVRGLMEERAEKFMDEAMAESGSMA